MDKRAIFIGGCPRSGTTMLGSMLGSTTNCITTPESHFKQKILVSLNADWSKGISKEKFTEALSKNFRFKIWGIPVPDISLPSTLMRSDYREILFKLVDDYARMTGKLEWNVWVDHTPQNFQNALMLLEIFPDAKFIHIIRDPRAVAASIIKLDWGPNTAEDAAMFWAQKISYALAFELLFPEKCLRVRYEDMVMNPEENIKEICDFANIEFRESMISGKEFRMPDYTKDQHTLVGQAPSQERINSWKNELTDLQIYKIQKLLEDLPEMMGYTKEVNLRPVTKNIVYRLFYKMRTKMLGCMRKKRFSAKKKKYGK